jgi:hypothetical protein
MSLRLRIYSVVAMLLILSYWCNTLPQVEHRRVIGLALIVLSVLCLEWIIRIVARETIQHLARRAGR